MNRCTHPRKSGSVAALVLVLLTPAGCDYSPPTTFVGSAKTYQPSALPSIAPAGPSAGEKSASKHLGIQRSSEERKAILESSMTLIQKAAIQPGGDNFRLAVQKLNQYFEGTSPVEYRLESAPREYLGTQLPPARLAELESTQWTLRDARHLEDCLMYYGIATRVAGPGEDLDRVRRVFEWVVRQVQLVPAGSLGSARLGQAFARPYDVLLRGMATEAEGFWAERAWLFMVMCRQLGVDCGLITYTKGNVVERIIPGQATGLEPEAAAVGPRRGAKVPVIWICAALINDQAYLFDARLGMEVSGPGGQGVATLAQALADPAILERMNLPGQSPYGTSRASLLASPTKLGVLIDSSLGSFSPRMRLLQRELAGKYRTILYRDPADQRARFSQVLAERRGGVSLWGLPLEVETELFRNPRFVESIQASLFFFQRDFPLIYARVKHLRGEIDEAIQDYVSLRFNENLAFVTDKKRAIPKDVREGLDIYATYYLALAHLERNDLKNAGLEFRKLLQLLPDPGPSQPFYNMFRWGAHTNLGRIAEALNDERAAVAHYTQSNPTSQYVGNLLRARDLVWRDPMTAPPDPLPPAPPPRPTTTPRPGAPSTVSQGR